MGNNACKREREWGREREVGERERKRKRDEEERNDVCVQEVCSLGVDL